MWMSEYGYKHEEGQVDTNSRDIDSRTTFLDVSDKQAMLDAFDISHCFKSDYTNYCVLLANKQSNGTDDIADSPEVNHEICILVTNKRNKFNQNGQKGLTREFERYLTDYQTGNHDLQSLATRSSTILNEFQIFFTVCKKKPKKRRIDQSIHTILRNFFLNIWLCMKKIPCQHPPPPNLWFFVFCLSFMLSFYLKIGMLADTDEAN